MEQWRDVAGWPGYSVSSEGRVRGPKGHVLKPVPVSGYAGLTFCRPGEKRRALVHIVVLEAFAGSRPAGLQVCHANGDKMDNRLANLRWGTAKENAADREAHGRAARGTRHGRSKLTPEMVREARSLWANEGKRGFACKGWSAKSLGARYGVSPASMLSALKGHTWNGPACDADGDK